MSPLKLLAGNTIKILGTIGLLLVGAIHTECEANLLDQCRTSSLQVGASYTRANIKIEDEPSFKGNLGGVQGSYEYKPDNNFYGGLRAAWKQGTTKNSFAKRKLVYVDVQERVGYTYASCCNDWTATLFSGFGYRYLGHELKQSEIPTIKFKYNEFYIPVGVLSEYLFSSCWTLGLNFTWMPQVFPTVEIVPLKGVRWILKQSMGNVLVELPFTYALTANKCSSLIIKPFYEHWEDGRSTAKNSNGQSLGLPKNSYNFWGIELNYSFIF